MDCELSLTRGWVDGTISAAWFSSRQHRQHSRHAACAKEAAGSLRLLQAINTPPRSLTPEIHRGVPELGVGIHKGRSHSWGPSDGAKSVWTRTVRNSEPRPRCLRSGTRGLSCDCHGWARAAGTPQRVASTITLNRAAGLRRSITTTHESTLIHDCGLLASRDTGGPRHSGGRLSRAAPGSGVRDYSVLCTVQRTVQVYVSSCDRFQIAYMWSGAVW